MGTGRVFAAELGRLLSGRALWLSGLALFALSALRVVAAHASLSAERARRLQLALARGSELDDSPDVLRNAFAPWVDGWRAGASVGTLLLLIFAARALAGDRESGLLRLASTRSATRSGLVLGRLCLAPFLTLGLVLASGAGSWLAASLLFRFGPLVEDGYEIWSEAELWSELATAVLAVLPPIVATFAFGLFVSAGSRSSVVALTVALVAFLGFDLFQDTLGGGRLFVFATYAPTLVDHSCLSEMSDLARGFSDAGYTAQELRMNHFVPWPHTLVFALLACWLASRKPL